MHGIPQWEPTALLYGWDTMFASEFDSSDINTSSISCMYDVLVLEGWEH